ncbi:hypothetical protein D3C73_1335700 [compost metagenome]
MTSVASGTFRLAHHGAQDYCSHSDNGRSQECCLHAGHHTGGCRNHSIDGHEQRSPGSTRNLLGRADNR